MIEFTEFTHFYGSHKSKSMFGVSEMRERRKWCHETFIGCNSNGKSRFGRKISKTIVVQLSEIIFRNEFDLT